MSSPIGFQLSYESNIVWPDAMEVHMVPEVDGYEKIHKMLGSERPHVYECVEGILERCHEMLPFEESLMAFYKEPQLREECFQKIADYKIESTQKIIDYYGRIDGALYHDDWDTQRSVFLMRCFGNRSCQPARFMGYLKKKAAFIERHSCGKNIKYVPNSLTYYNQRFGRN